MVLARSLQGPTGQDPAGDATGGQPAPPSRGQRE